MRIEKTISESTRILEREAVMQTRLAIKTGTIRMWKGRKIISVEKFVEIGNCNNQKNDSILEYIPDDYVEYVATWFLHIADKSQIKKWLGDYFEYLKSKKNPGHGKAQCKNCILNRHGKTTSTSIRDILLNNAFDDHLELCDVENIFDCPHEQTAENNDLLGLGTIWNTVHTALENHYWNRYYDVDFERNIVIEKSPGKNQYTINDAVKKLVRPIHVVGIQDIFDVLTHPDMLARVFDQHIQLVNERERSDKEEIKRLEKIKTICVNVFSEIKDKIKIGEIRDLYNNTIDYERKEHGYAKIELHGVQHSEHNPNSLCPNCKNYGEFRCLNCNVNVCYEHWFEHGQAVHSYKN